MPKVNSLYGNRKCYWEEFEECMNCSYRLNVNTVFAKLCEPAHTLSYKDTSSKIVVETAAMVN